MLLGGSRAAPTVSILIPVWNEAATIGECIGDVRAQVGVDWECVLVLDGPTDGTPEVVRSLVSGDPRFVVDHRPHAGLVTALEAGRVRCRGRYIARFDADDRMHPERLARQTRLLDEHPEVGVVSCRLGHGVIGGSGECEAPAGMVRHVGWWNSLETGDKLALARFIDAPICHPSALIRSELLHEFGYIDGPFAEDHDLWLRMLERGVVFAKVPSDIPLVTWRERPGRATRVDGRYGDEARRALVHRHLLAGPLNDDRHVRLWGAGRYGRWHGKHLRRLGVPIDDAIDIDPKKVGRTIIDGVPVVGVETLGSPDGRCLLVCVASPGARALIAADLTRSGWREGSDWWALQ